MADVKITELPELTEVAADDYLEIVDTSTNTSKKISRETLTNHDSDYLGITAQAADSDKLDGLDSTDFGRPVFLSAPLTSTSWNGNLFSTTSKTLLDLSAVFGAPAGIKAIIAEYSIKDTGSSNGTCRLVLSPNNVNMIGVHLMGSPTDGHLATSNAIIPCDANGDIYYQIVASGTNTMTIYFQILGYWL